MDKNILFLHGLDAGLSGEKTKFLKREFPFTSICPDLEVSKYKIYLKNAFLRNLLINRLFLGTLAGISLFYYLSNSMFGHFTSLIISIIVITPILALSKNYFLRYSVRKSLENNIELAYNLIKKHEPKILIGSSWGGSVILNLIQRGMWEGHSILIAPAFYAVNNVVFNNQKEKIRKFKLNKAKNFKGNIIIYHSIDDELIPYADTSYLCGLTEGYDKTFKSENLNHNKLFFESYKEDNMELKTFKGIDHVMNELMYEPESILKNDILELLNKI